MKRLVLLALLASACRINDTSFTPLGGGDDGGPDDGNLDDTPIMLIDAPAGLQPLRRAFLIDQNAGIWSLDKNAQTGDLTLAMPTPTSTLQPTVAAMNRTGTHLYVAGGQTVAEIRDYVVNNTTIGNGPNVIQLGNCAGPRSITVHPNGRFLFVGCTSQAYVRVSIDTTGALATKQEILSTLGPTSVAFSPNGACLVVGDANAPATQRVQSYKFDPLSGALTQQPVTTGPTGPSAIAMHPSNKWFYVAGSNGTTGQVTAYALEPTTCEIAPLAGGTLTTPQSAAAMVVDPPGGRLYLVGSEVYSYSISANGFPSQNAGSPFLTGTSLLHAVFDPAVPSTIYVSGRTPLGTHQGEIDMSSGSFAIGQGYAPPNGAPSMFVMAP